MSADTLKSCQTTCPYCGVGCGVDTTVQDNQIIAVSGSREHSANWGRLCVKGSALHETTGMDGRLLHPRIRGRRASWDDAIDKVAGEFSRLIAEHGPESVAFYLSGQLLTEDYYVANKLMKGFIGAGNVDTNSRLCMAAAAAGYKRALGEDAVPGCYEDLENCDLLVMVGSNAAWTHPVIFQRIQAAKEKRPAMRVVVIDPRRTATCELADLHLAINPATDAFLFVGLLHYLYTTGRLDNRYIDNHTSDFDTVLNVAQQTSLESLPDLLGVDSHSLDTFFRWYGETEKTVTLYSQGINQSSTGTDKGNAIINCHLATGRIGREGMGPFSITGQPNAMGGREVGGLSTQLAAHMDFSPENVERVGRFWGSDRVARREGLKAVDLFDAVHAGKVKAVWIMATNPVVSLPEADRVREALKKCELVVVSDCVEKTDTTACADVLFPATGWGEKDGTVTNSERTISRQRGVLSPPGEARHDWQIVCAVACKMGFAQAFDFRSSRDIFCEHAALTGFENAGSRALDISGLAELSQQEYDELTPIQWPVNQRNPAGKMRLFEDGVFPTRDGRARFIPVEPRMPPQAPSQRYPYVLNTGRIRDQWHTMTRTGKAARLLNHIDAPALSLNPKDAQKLNISAGELVDVQSRYGAVTLQVDINDSVKPGELFAPIHWNDQFASAARVGSLVAPITDISGQPESKYIPVSILKINVQYWIHLASEIELDMARFGFWLKTPFGKGYRYKAACLDADFDVISWLKSVIPVSANVIDYTDSAKGEYRLVCESNGKRSLLAFVTERSGELPDGSWMSDAFAGGSADNWSLLAGRNASGADKGRLVCSCYEVGEKEIIRAITEGCATTKMLGERLKCGTNCGSCLPELKGLIGQSQLAAEAS